MTDLRSSWSRVWHGVGAAGDGESIYRSLLDRYGEPHRKYHTRQHLTECLVAFDAVSALPPHPAEVEAALWFHDAIYEVRRSDNEERSAQWARSALLSAGARVESAELIHSLVMVTKHTATPVTLDEQVLIDVDLGILGASKERFAEYERQIREEYGHVPMWLFRRKRRAILQSFLDRPRIFSTPHFHAALERPARENLSRVVDENAA
jgi:predicted metal-dependent HD superfamily phosphohydrolase